jgi:hypothetical protein
MTNRHVGSTFDDFLAEHGIREEASVRAATRVLTWRIAQIMTELRFSKTEIARRTKT